MEPGQAHQIGPQGSPLVLVPALLSLSVGRWQRGPTRQSFLLPPATGPADPRHAVGEPPALLAERSSISSSTRIPWDTQATLYSLLAPPATSMADGNVGRASADRHKQVKHQPKGAQVSATHCDLNGVDSGGREARRRAGRGEVLAAAFLPEMGKTGSAGSFRGLERAVKGPGGGWVAGEADAVHWGGEKGVSAVNFAVARARLVGALRGKQRCVVRWSGF